MAPSHRHVLRAASRLFVHIGDSERAHAILLRSPRTPRDPWLIATEIATANISEKAPRFVKQGRELINSGALPDAHLTELLSAIGTFEHYNGAHRKARKHFSRSLSAPNENVVAQARWVRTQLPSLAISDDSFSIQRGYEARTWRALEQGDWAAARENCAQWLNDEPFSSRPASLGSFIGTSLDLDFAFAERCALAGRISAPQDPMLKNNLSVAIAYQGKLDEAVKIFQTISVSDIIEHASNYTFVATAGLLAFRNENIEMGRELYDKAFDLAPRSICHRVSIYRAREELFANTIRSGEYVARAMDFKPDEKDVITKRQQALLARQGCALKKLFRTVDVLDACENSLAFNKRLSR